MASLYDTIMFKQPPPKHDLAARWEYERCDTCLYGDRERQESPCYACTMAHSLEDPAHAWQPKDADHDYRR